MRGLYVYRLPIMFAASGLSVLALMLLGPMFLAYAMSGGIPQRSRDAIWLFMMCWALFFAGAPLASWISWFFSKRAALMIALAIIAAVALPFVIMFIWQIVAIIWALMMVAPSLSPRL